MILKGSRERGCRQEGNVDLNVHVPGNYVFKRSLEINYGKLMPGDFKQVNGEVN